MTEIRSKVELRSSEASSRRDPLLSLLVSLVLL